MQSVWSNHMPRCDTRLTPELFAKYVADAAEYKDVPRAPAGWPWRVLTEVA